MLAQIQINLKFLFIDKSKIDNIRWCRLLHHRRLDNHHRWGFQIHLSARNTQSHGQTHHGHSPYQTARGGTLFVVLTHHRTHPY